jgi:hypothetical protein
MGGFRTKAYSKHGVFALNPLCDIKDSGHIGWSFRTKKIQFLHTLGVSAETSIFCPFCEDFGIDFVTDGRSSTGSGRDGFLYTDPMGFFEAGEGGTDK